MTAYQKNVLACYGALLAHLKNINGISAVREIEDFSALKQSRRVVPQDGELFVIFDGISPVDENNARRECRMELSFSLILAKSHFKPSAQTALVGETLARILVALQGWFPKGEKGQALCSAPFRARNGGAGIVYFEGFGLFPLRFSTEIILSGR